MIRTLLLTLLFLFTGTIFSQTFLLDSVSLAVHQEYTDLKEALENPLDVVKLSLRKKKFESFPKEVLQFKNLQYLDLSKNDIKELPDSIVILQDLQYLIMSRTGL